MKHIAFPALIVLAACVQQAPIEDYNAPYNGKWSPRPEPRPERVQTVCPPKSPRAGKPVKAGHENVLCYGEPSSAPSEPEPKEPPTTECTDASKWLPTQYALGGGQKKCA